MFYKRQPIRDIVLILERFRRQTLVGGELIRDIFLQIHLKSWLKVVFYYI